MYRLEIERDPSSEHQTLGILKVLDGDLAVYECKTLELPWRDNKRSISCIPPGVYTVVRRDSAKFKDHFHIKDVPGRDFILIHPANYVTELRGCIAPGKTHQDINGDGVKDITSSKDTLRGLLMLMDDEFILTIKNKRQYMKGKDIIKSLLGGANEVLPTISIKKNKEENKGKINLVKLLTGAAVGLVQTILIAKGLSPELITGLMALFGL
jgi:hypothetical protein